MKIIQQSKNSFLLIIRSVGSIYDKSVLYSVEVMNRFAKMADYLTNMLSFNIFGVLFFSFLNYIIYRYRIGYKQSLTLLQASSTTKLWEIVALEKHCCIHRSLDFDRTMHAVLVSKLFITQKPRLKEICNFLCFCIHLWRIIDKRGFCYNSSTEFKSISDRNVQNFSWYIF